MGDENEHGTFQALSAVACVSGEDRALPAVPAVAAAAAAAATKPPSVINEVPFEGSSKPLKLASVEEVPDVRPLSTTSEAVVQAAQSTNLVQMMEQDLLKNTKRGALGVGAHSVTTEDDDDKLDGVDKVMAMAPTHEAPDRLSVSRTPPAPRPDNDSNTKENMHLRVDNPSTCGSREPSGHLVSSVSTKFHTGTSQSLLSVDTKSLANRRTTFLAKVKSSRGSDPIEENPAADEENPASDQHNMGPGAFYARRRRPNEPRFIDEAIDGEELDDEEQGGGTDALPSIDRFNSTAAPSSDGPPSGMLAVATAVNSAEMVVMAEAETVKKSQHKNRRWGTFLGGVLLSALIVGLSVGMTKGSGVSGNEKNDKDNEVDYCLQQEPDIVSQCRCNNTIYHLTDDLVAGFENITALLIATGINVTNNTAESSVCEPTVVSRYWLAANPAPTVEDLHQRYAISVFYWALNGTEWSEKGQKNWFSQRDFCDDWGGIGCRRGMIQKVKLSDENLRGQLPTESGLLTTVSELTLSSNFISGTIPTEIGLLTAVSELKLSSNFISGTIPTEIGLLTTVSEFRLSSNSISGTIPTEVGSMSDLKACLLEDNQLSGDFRLDAFPTNTKMIRLERNKLSGSIKAGDQLDQFRKLKLLTLQDNHFTGTLPSSLWTLPSLTWLDLNNNNLTGSLPEEYSMFAEISGIGLANNSLTGTLPESYSALTTMRFIRLEGNLLQGTVPEAYCDNFTVFEQGVIAVSDCDAEDDSFSSNCTCCECWPSSNVAPMYEDGGSPAIQGKEASDENTIRPNNSTDGKPDNQNRPNSTNGNRPDNPNGPNNPNRTENQQA